MIRYISGWVPKLKIGNQSFEVGIITNKKQAKWVKEMLTKALQNLIYGELQRYERFRASYMQQSKFMDNKGETVEIIIEKYLK